MKLSETQLKVLRRMKHRDIVQTIVDGEKRFALRHHSGDPSHPKQDVTADDAKALIDSGAVIPWAGPGSCLHYAISRAGRQAAKDQP